MSDLGYSEYGETWESATADGDWEVSDDGTMWDPSSDAGYSNWSSWSQTATEDDWTNYANTLGVSVDDAKADVNSYLSSWDTTSTDTTDTTTTSVDTTDTTDYSTSSVETPTVETYGSSATGLYTSDGGEITADSDDAWQLNLDDYALTEVDTDLGNFDTTLVSDTMNGLLSADSLYRQQLETQAAQSSAESGLLNTTMAETAGLSAAISGAYDIAVADADAQNTTMWNQQEFESAAALQDADAANSLTETALEGDYGLAQTGYSSQMEKELMEEDQANTLEQMAATQDYTLEQMAAEQGYDVQSMGFQQSLDLEQMAAEFGYDIATMTEEQANELALMAEEQGYTLEQLEETQEDTLEQMDAEQENTLEQMAAEQGYTLEELGITQDYTLEQMLEEHELDKEILGLEQDYTLAQMLEEHNYTMEQLAIEQDYIIEQLQTEAELNKELTDLQYGWEETLKQMDIDADTLASTLDNVTDLNQQYMVQWTEIVNNSDLDADTKEEMLEDLTTGHVENLNMIFDTAGIDFSVAADDYEDMGQADGEGEDDDGIEYEYTDSDGNQGVSGDPGDYGNDGLEAA